MPLQTWRNRSGASLEEQLPRLTNSQLTAPEIHDLLLEIGEEFRHILYHIKGPKFYRYLGSGQNA
jgi:hypothetical protein